MITSKGAPTGIFAFITPVSTFSIVTERDKGENGVVILACAQNDDNDVRPSNKPSGRELRSLLDIPKCVSEVRLLKTIPR